jgi:hypothetical protein
VDWFGNPDARVAPQQELRVATMRAMGFIRSKASSILIAGATATAGGILAIVVLYVLTD